MREENNNVRFSSILDRLYCLEKKTELLDNDLDFLTRTTSSYSWEIRNRTAEILIQSCSDRSRRLLLTLCNDKKYLVRASACESLCSFNDEEVMHILMDKVNKDSSPIVRCYATLALGDISLRANVAQRELLTSFFLHIKKKSRSPVIQIAVCRNLYLLGYHEYMKEMLKAAKNEKYHIRHHAIRSLWEVMNSTNKCEILSCLEEQKKTESTKSVIALIETILADEQIVIHPSSS